jgi:hypothetical protein
VYLGRYSYSEIGSRNGGMIYDFVAPL